MKKEEMKKKTAEARLKSVKVSPIKLSALTRSIAGMPVENFVLIREAPLILIPLHIEESLKTLSSSSVSVRTKKLLA